MKLGHFRNRQTLCLQSKEVMGECYVFGQILSTWKRLSESRLAVNKTEKRLS